MNMGKWLYDIKSAKTKKPLPILSFPAVRLIDTTIDRIVKDGALQAQALRELIKRYDMPAVVMFMDLSVEAEAFGSPVIFSDDEVPVVSSSILHTEKDADSLEVPAIGAARIGEFIKAVVETKKLIPDRPVLAGAIGPFTLAGRLLNMTEIMILSMMEPSLVEKCWKRRLIF